MGIEINRIKNTDVDQALICSICMNILLKPVACGLCFNHYCGKCIDKWIDSTQKQKACPLCKGIFLKIKAIPLLYNFLGKFEIECIYIKNGCKESINYDLLEKHEKNCQFMIIKCEGCKDSLFLKDKESHYKNCKNLYVSCPICRLMIFIKDVETHYKSICIFKNDVHFELIHKLTKLEIDIKKLSIEFAGIQKENLKIKLIIDEKFNSYRKLLPFLTYKPLLCGGLDTLVKTNDNTSLCWRWVTTNYKLLAPYEVCFEILSFPDHGFHTWGGAIGVSSKMFDITEEIAPELCWEKDAGIFCYILGNGRIVNRSSVGLPYRNFTSTFNKVIMRVSREGSLSFHINNEDMGEAFKISDSMFIFIALANPGAIKMAYIKFNDI